MRGVVKGGNSSGSSKTKFANVTISLTAPSSPILYDIWVKSSNTTLNQIYFYGGYPTLNNNDILIGLANQQQVFKPVIDKGINHTDLPLSSGLNCKYLTTDYFDNYAKYLIVKKNITGTVTILPAYYWNGSDWIQFSFEDEYVLAKSGSDNASYKWNIFRATDVSLQAQVAATTTGFNYYYIGFDEERTVLMFYYNNTITETDLFLNVVKTMNVGSSFSDENLLFYKNGKYYSVYYNGSNVLLYDVTNGANTLVYTTTSSYGGYSIQNISLDKKKNFLYVKMIGNGDPSNYHFILNITNMSSITDQVVTVGAKEAMVGLCVCDNKLIAPKASGGVIVFEERSLDYNTLLKSVTTTIPDSISTYYYRYLMGQDNDGNYYVTKWYSYGGTTKDYVTKISPTGETLYEIVYSTSYGAPMIFTSGQRLLVTSSNKLTLLNPLDGTVVITGDTSYVRLYQYALMQTGNAAK